MQVQGKVVEVGLGGGGWAIIETEEHSSYPALAFYLIILALIPTFVLRRSSRDGGWIDRSVLGLNLLLPPGLGPGRTPSSPDPTTMATYQNLISR